MGRSHFTPRHHLGPVSPTIGVNFNHSGDVSVRIKWKNGEIHNFQTSP